jgi:hypothetical protein
MPLSIQDYKTKAAECDLMAMRATDHAIKSAFQKIARAWRELGGQIEVNASRDSRNVRNRTSCAEPKFNRHF